MNSSHATLAPVPLDCAARLALATPGHFVIFEDLEAHAALHSEVLEQHFVHHLGALQAGKFPSLCQTSSI